MNWRDYVERRPGVMLGKPVCKGTRITVELLLQRLGEGDSVEDLLTSYPHLKREHLQAALAYASEMIGTDELVVLEETK